MNSGKSTFKVVMKLKPDRSTNKVYAVYGKSGRKLRIESLR